MNYAYSLLELIYIQINCLNLYSHEKMHELIFVAFSLYFILIYLNLKSFFSPINPNNCL